MGDPCYIESMSVSDLNISSRVTYLTPQCFAILMCTRHVSHISPRRVLPSWCEHVTCHRTHHAVFCHSVWTRHVSQISPAVFLSCVLAAQKFRIALVAMQHGAPTLPRPRDPALCSHFCAVGMTISLKVNWYRIRDRGTPCSVHPFLSAISWQSQLMACAACTQFAGCPPERAPSWRPITKSRAIGWEPEKVFQMPLREEVQLHERHVCCGKGAWSRKYTEAWA
jgi:hypothetical protein